MTDPKGTTAYPPRLVCGCGHGDALHDLNARKVRTACSVTDLSGPCGCTRFVAHVEEAPTDAVDAWADMLFDQRDAALEAIARVRRLHQQYRGVPDYDTCAHCNQIGDVQWVAYPCPTIRALNGEVGRG